MATQFGGNDQLLKKCGLKSCGDSDSSRHIKSDEGRVEVRAFKPRGQTAKLNVEWTADGSAVFHQPCWFLLVKKTERNDTTSMSDIERSMVLEAKKTAEFHDSKSSFADEATRIAAILKESKYCIAFTGAGISTAAGIEDFRGKDGHWTERARVKNYGSSPKTPKTSCSPEQRRPTYTHEALFKLLEMGILKFIISQNTDGLHRLSGIPSDKISELHGNSFTEKCEECGTRYDRKLACRKIDSTSSVPPLKCSRCRINHRTGRTCKSMGCKGYLMNTIINFGDFLEDRVISKAEAEARNADTVLVLGSTLRVSPANSLVMLGQKPHRIIMCNRQSTPYDEDCGNIGPDGNQLGSRVFGDCDRLMKLVMKKLLPANDLQEWEDGRSARMMQYTLERTTE